MGMDVIYVRIAESANSETFKGFMEYVRGSHPKSCMVLDNASHHHSHTINEYSVDQKFFTFRDFLQMNSITSILGRAVLKYSDIALRICTIVA